MRKRVFIIASMCVFLFNCRDFMDTVSLNALVNGTTKMIRSDYKGIIIEKYAPRETKPNYIKIKTLENEIIDIGPNRTFVDNVIVGDSVFKVKNENKVIIKKSNGEKFSYFYTYISKEIRNHKDFPKEWKGKWAESTITVDY